MTCPKCKSTDVRVQVVTNVSTKRRGILGWLFWILLACMTFGLVIVIPLVTNSKTVSRTHTVCVCQNCAYTWNK